MPNIFRKGKSCVSDLLCFYSRVIDIVQEREGWVDSVYLGLRKVFDKVPLNRLVWKLKKVGRVSGKLAELMENYLLGRDADSSEGKEIGVERSDQWSAAGVSAWPHYVFIYVNNMPEVRGSYMNMFGDDAKIMRSEKPGRLISYRRTWTRYMSGVNNGSSHVMKMGKSKYRSCKEYKFGRGGD